MRRRDRDRLPMELALAAAAIGVVVIAGLALVRPPRLDQDLGYVEIGFLAALALGVAGLWTGHSWLAQHFDDLRRLRSLLVALDRSDRFAPPLPEHTEGEVGRLALAIADTFGFLKARAATPDQRLTEILGAISDGVVVVTDTELVSLVNPAAKGLLADRVAVGTSLFQAIDRDSFASALAEIREARRPVAYSLRLVDGDEMHATLAALGDGSGIVLTFSAWDLSHGGDLEHDLTLHEAPPTAPTPDAETLLAALPASALDTETTGLDVSLDRVVSVGAVRMHGGRIYHAHTFDRLVDPGGPIPARSIAFHGITDAMVKGAPACGDVLRDLLPRIAGTVLIGHNIGFDLGLLQAEARRSGLLWPDIPALDTLLLAAALWPGVEELDLDAIAARLNVEVAGRHTALGDALVTAEIFARLMPLLADAGVTTLGQAMTFTERARHIRRLQRRAGW